MEALLVNITIAKRKMGPFCVLGLTSRRAASCFKFLKTRDLSSLANKMHKQQRREKRDEQSTLRRNGGLFGTSKATRRMREGLGNLERASGRVLLISYERKRGWRRTPAVASKLRPRLHSVDSTRTQMLVLSVGIKRRGVGS